MRRLFSFAMATCHWEQFCAHCAAFSREFPYVHFAIFSLGPEDDNIEVFGSGLSYVPTFAMYRNGKQYAQIVGTDYDGTEKRYCAALDAMDGALAPPHVRAPRKNAVYQD